MWAKVLVYMILFFLVANPATFKTMRKVLGSWVASADGLPSNYGLLLHSAVYVLLAHYIPGMVVSGYEDEGYIPGKYTSNSSGPTAQVTYGQNDSPAPF
jgi:hypothetical protein